MADWVEVEVSIQPLTKQVEPIIQSMDTVLGFLITVLNVVQTILSIVQVFMVGLLDPIRAIVELIIEEIQSLIQDLRQLGVYLTGDWELLRSGDKFGNLVGGYQAYERRMVGRLQDRTDINRPDYSSSTAVLGAFFYASSDDINDLVRILGSFLRFFGQSDLAGRSSAYGRPTTPEMKYGLSGASTASYRPLGNPKVVNGAAVVADAVSVTWSMPSGTGGMRLFSPAPKGFLIHASTIPDGLNAIALVVKDTDNADVVNLPRVSSAAIDPTTNGPLKLYGGIADLGAAADSTDFSEVSSDDPRANLLVLYLKLESQWHQHRHTKTAFRQ